MNYPPDLKAFCLTRARFQIFETVNNADRFQGHCFVSQQTMESAHEWVKLCFSQFQQIFIKNQLTNCSLAIFFSIKCLQMYFLKRLIDQYPNWNVLIEMEAGLLNVNTSGHLYTRHDVVLLLSHRLHFVCMDKIN